MLSVIIPAYNEEQIIEHTSGVIASILDEAEIDFEVIFVDDGSRDKTWASICECSDQDKRIRGISFSRNFGKESAMFAGLTVARGDCVVIIDCDLQHPPEKIVEMYRLWEQGYEVIEGVKENRGRESVAHGFAARCFYKLLSRAVKIDMSQASDFKLLDRKAVDVLIRMPEKNLFFRALSSWIGFRTATVSYDVQERQQGQSKWSTWSLIKYALTNVASFSTAPMQIVTGLGILTLIISVIFGAITLVQKMNGHALGGFTTMILLQGLTSGVVMISLGIIGYYIAKIYEEIKGRPRYIIARDTEKEQ